jgi:hypothetical protein
MDNIRDTDDKKVNEITSNITQTKLVDISVTNENEAFNLLISFISVAHKRGAFTIDESAKIWECIKVFQKPESDF